MDNLAKVISIWDELHLQSAYVYALVCIVLVHLRQLYKHLNNKTVDWNIITTSWLVIAGWGVLLEFNVLWGMSSHVDKLFPLWWSTNATPEMWWAATVIGLVGWAAFFWLLLTSRRTLCFVALSVNIARIVCLVVTQGQVLSPFRESWGATGVCLATFFLLLFVTIRRADAQRARDSVQHVLIALSSLFGIVSTLALLRLIKLI